MCFRLIQNHDVELHCKEEFILIKTLTIRSFGTVIFYTALLQYMHICLIQISTILTRCTDIFIQSDLQVRLGAIKAYNQYRNNDKLLCLTKIVVLELPSEVGR